MDTWVYYDLSGQRSVGICYSSLIQFGFFLRLLRWGDCGVYRGTASKQQTEANTPPAHPYLPCPHHIVESSKHRNNQ